MNVKLLQQIMSFRISMDPDAAFDIKLRACQIAVNMLCGENLSQSEMEQVYGKEKVWTPQRFQQQFTIISDVLCPLLIVERNSDKAKGMVFVQRDPCLFFCFQTVNGDI